MDDLNLSESSCKKHGLSESSSSGSNRPLKKAKFPWQVKGKYHLKEHEEIMDEESLQDDENSKNQQDDDNKAENHLTSDEENKFENKVEENLEMLGDYLLKQDFSSLNTLLFGPELEQKTSKKSNDSLSLNSGTSSTYPKYTPSYKKVPNSNNNIESSVDSSILDLSKSSTNATNITPSPSVIKQRASRIEDQYLKRWQARQIAKGYVDNTINRVLDSWFVTPLPPHVDDSRQLTLDVTGLLDDLTGNDGIENEGILMAISAHGLQNNQTTPRNIDSSVRNRNFRNTEPENINSNPQKPKTSSASNSSTPQACTTDESQSGKKEFEKTCVKDDETATTPSICENHISNVIATNTTDLIPSPVPPPWTYLSQSCVCSNTHRRTNNNSVTNIPFHRRNESNFMSQSTIASSGTAEKVSKITSDATSSNSSNVTNISLNDRTSDDNSDSNESSHESAENKFSVLNENNEQFGEHFDFMDAAVQIAIQSKGLIQL